MKPTWNTRNTTQTVNQADTEPWISAAQQLQIMVGINGLKYILCTLKKKKKKKSLSVLLHYSVDQIIEINVKLATLLHCYLKT